MAKKQKELATVKITQTKSLIGSSKKQKKIMQAIGVRRINHSIDHVATPSMIGMIEKVSHLIAIEKK